MNASVRLLSSERTHERDGGARHAWHAAELADGDGRALHARLLQADVRDDAGRTLEQAAPRVGAFIVRLSASVFV